jgi:hypothetical protein
MDIRYMGDGYIEEIENEREGDKGKHKSSV